jgi:hypothetical protein
MQWDICVQPYVGVWLEVDDTMSNLQQLHMIRMLPTSDGICHIHVLHTCNSKSHRHLPLRCVHSKYYCYPLLINELIQLSVVDADRAPLPCGRGDFVSTDIDGA